jgi:TRAP-type mannitol/chloroaromatic compound transport system permease small subunit
MSFIDKLNELISRIVSWLVIFLIVELVYDTVMRYVFNVAVEWSYDISYMLYGIIFMLAIPHVEYLNKHLSCDKKHYNQRSMVERVNKLLKDDFGCNTIYYQGATKVASVLAFGILSICIDQSLKLVT